MALTPLDIHNKQFKKRLFGGFDRDEVDGFLDQVIREFEVYAREINRYKEQIEHLTQKLVQYRSLEETINKTMVVAQETAEEIKGNARREADLIIQEARLQAERIIQAGQAKSRRIAEENADLVRAAFVLRTQVRAMLQAQLEALGELKDPFTQAAPSQMEPEKQD